MISVLAGILQQQTSVAAPFVPTDVSGLEAWWDANDASTFTYSTGTKVAQWDDKSGNSRHVVQASASLQPSRSAIYGPLTAVSFLSGSDNIMRTASAVTIAQPYTVFAVSSVAFPGGAASRILSHRSTANVQLVQGVLSSGHSIYAGTGFVNSGSVPSAGVLHQSTGLFNGASSVSRTNGVAGSTGNAGTASLDLVTLGASGNSSNYLFGNIAEVLVYSGALSSADRDAVESYLSSKWGTP